MIQGNVSMTNSYFKSVSEKEDALNILGLDLPSYRQAYSDRTAWIMSVMSELVYIKFNPAFGVGRMGLNSAESVGETKSDFIKSYLIARFAEMEKTDGFALLDMLREQILHDPAKAQETLEQQLGELNFAVIDTFDCKGSQAILVEHKDYLVLSFRGTETDSLRDIKADADAELIACETKGKIHKGFYEAYNLIRHDIEIAIDKPALNKKPLYITGHSLGGALATIATKFTYHKGGLAACYTFGSPRVGDEVWINNIKTPIHRLVNAADCVTMLPPSYESITLLSLILKAIPTQLSYRFAMWLEDKFGGYIHAGNMRYLSNCPKGDYSDVKVLYTVSLLYRFIALIKKELPFKKLATDHSISVYSKKLMLIAFKRNKSRMDAMVKPTAKANQKTA
jgi:hypothetical protein